ncbi:hypothetical protein HY338_01245, partial [Candidatus Gottesmanbacteria bacterium]|nr:hypothetical protein [Candidatus Gottesmanbacteria bacterium]
MLAIPHLKIHFSKIQILALILLLFLLFYPSELEIKGLILTNDFIKERVLSLGILFLILRGIIDDYYSPKLAIIFLFILILAPTFNFGQLVVVTLT